MAQGMTETYDLILKNGTCVTPNGTEQTDIAVKDGKIAGLGDFSDSQAGEVFDAKALHILPGVIDSQVHFREPGLTHKEDLESGTRGAALGGVTTIFEMPNTNPLTLTQADFQDKLDRADGRAWCDYGFFVGGSAANADHLAELERLPGCSGVKVFMGSSTGDLLTDEENDLKRILDNGIKRVTVHAEDEARLKERAHIAEEEGHPRAHPIWRDEETALMATKQLVSLARAARGGRSRPVQVLHITTADEITYLIQNKDIATFEITPQHLTFAAPDCYEKLGSLVQMNPPIRDQRHQDVLWEAIRQGAADTIGSDHAPHTLEEKQKPYPQTPSGMTGVQTLVPVMLSHVNAGRLSLERFVDLTTAGPARVFGLKNKGRLAPGYDADFTVVDMAAKRRIENDWIASKSGWTPYDGFEATAWPVATLIRGQSIMRDDTLIGDPQGHRAEFF